MPNIRIDGNLIEICADSRYRGIILSPEGPRFVGLLTDILQEITGKKYGIAVTFSPVLDEELTEKDLVYGFAAQIQALLNRYGGDETAEEFGCAVAATYEVFSEMVPRALDIPVDRLHSACDKIASEVARRYDCTTER